MRRGPSIPPLTILYSKMLIFIVCNESVTDRPTNGRTNGRTNRRKDRPTDGWTDPVIEMRGRIKKYDWILKTMTALCLINMGTERAVHLFLTGLLQN